MCHFAASAGEGTLDERPQWSTHFQSNGQPITGTVAIVDTRTTPPAAACFNHERATTRFSPASTFKIPHTLIALDAGVVRDEFEVIEWDGVERSHTPWNQNQTLRSAMRHSTVWVYERIAAKVGIAKEQTYLEKINYGNRTTRGAMPFWIEGDLSISAAEQITFLRKLHTNSLPFSEAHQRLVKDLMIVEAGKEYILRAKSGWNGQLGWWVGWIELPSGTVFFALNIDTPNGMADLPARERITRNILNSLNALPINNR
ncbi:class D beta-lactamase [Sulfuriroseicoccus oceanibius]